jgi:hypothetical protein
MNLSGQHIEAALEKIDPGGLHHEIFPSLRRASFHVGGEEWGIS